MRRGAKPAKAKVEARRPVARKSPKKEASKRRELEKRLAESLERERAKDRVLAEALDQQTATSEILRVISSSPTDVQPVFMAVLASAARLCDALDATMFRVDGDVLLLVAHEGPILSDPVGTLRPLTPATPSGRAVLEGRTIQVADIQADVGEYPEGSAFARALNFRTVLSVPLMREGTALGAIAIRRTEVRPFTDRQTELLKTFADQAVIAIENVRLFTELQEKNLALTAAHAQVTEALEQQTATAEILRVISRSPTDLRPVMEAVAENAARLCDATDAQILRGDGETITLVASYGRLPTITTEPRRISRRLVGGRAIIDRMTLHISDVRAVRDEFPDSATVQLGVRTRSGDPPAARRRCDRRDHDSAHGGSALLRQPDRPAPDLRRPSRHRHRERAAVYGAGGTQPRPDQGAGHAD